MGQPTNWGSIMGFMIASYKALKALEYKSENTLKPLFEAERQSDSSR